MRCGAYKYEIALRLWQVGCGILFLQLWPKQQRDLIGVYTWLFRMMLLRIGLYFVLRVGMEVRCTFKELGPCMAAYTWLPLSVLYF
jgi:hypothetical protein